MRSVAAWIAAILLAHCAAAAQRSLPPLQCLDERGRPFPDVHRNPPTGGTVTGARVIHREWPPWPKGSVRVSGPILIESIVDRHGRVCAARLLKGSGPLAESAVRSLKRWKFEPARINGRTIPVYFTVFFWVCPR